MRRFYFLSGCALLLLPSAGQAADRTSQWVRLAIVDDSGSMRHERVETVKKELLKVARQLPPTPQCPFGLITFGSSADSVRWYTDFAGIERAISRLNGNSGGTNIASGLEEAARALKPHLQSGHLCILLYTDGEDGDQDGILRAEARLDALFAQRQQVGLSQTVFCKRWGNSNAALIEQFKRHNRANLVDAGELSILPLTFVPAVAVNDVRWESLTADRLSVTWTSSVTVRGVQETLAPVRFKCLNSPATGHVESRVVPNSTAAVVRTVVVRVSEAERKAGRLTLHFRVTLPSGQKTASGIVLPSLKNDRLNVAVTLPVRTRRRELKATMTKRGAPTWHDPLDQLVACSVNLTASFKALNGDDHRQPSRFRIIADRHCRIVTGPQEFELTANRPKAIPLTLVTRSAADSQVGLSVVPVGDQSPIVYTPPRVHAILTGWKTPAAVTSTITARVNSVSAPQWVNLADCTARLIADVEFEVNGPITNGARFTLVVPAQVTAFEFSPQTLHTGKQTARFTLDARLDPAPDQTTLTFRIVPPSPVGGVRFAAPKPFGFRVVGPSVVSLALAGTSAASRPLRTAMADNDQTALLPLTPVLSGATTEAVRSIAVDLSASGAQLSTRIPAARPLYSRAETQIHVAPPIARPFFQDVIVRGQVALQSNPPTPAVQSVQYPLEIVLRAPFKRLAFLLAVSLSVLVTVIMLLRMYLNLRKTED